MAGRGSGPGLRGGARPGAGRPRLLRRRHRPCRCRRWRPPPAWPGPTARRLLLTLEELGYVRSRRGVRADPQGARPRHGLRGLARALGHRPPAPGGRSSRAPGAPLDGPAGRLGHRLRRPGVGAQDHRPAGRHRHALPRRPRPRRARCCSPPSPRGAGRRARPAQPRGPPASTSAARVERLREELVGVRARGWASPTRSWRRASLGRVPVRDGRGAVRAAMNVTVHAAETSTAHAASGAPAPAAAHRRGGQRRVGAVAVPAARRAPPPRRRGFGHRLTRVPAIPRAERPVDPVPRRLRPRRQLLRGVPPAAAGDRGVARAHRAVLQPHRLRRVARPGLRRSGGRRGRRGHRRPRACWAAATPSSPGYLGSADIGHAVVGAVARVRAANPAAVYCCDPVIGDVGRGVFVRPGIPEFMREVAVPAADLVTPNHFELDLLSGTTTRSLASVKDAVAAVQALGPRVVLTTSLVAEDTPDDAVDLLASEGGRHWRVRTPRLDVAVNGAGDAIAALFLAHWLDTRLGRRGRSPAPARRCTACWPRPRRPARGRSCWSRRRTSSSRPAPRSPSTRSESSAAPHRRAEDLRRGRATARDSPGSGSARRLEGEAGGGDRGGGVPGGVAAAPDRRPHRPVEQPLHPREPGALGPDVLPEVQPAAGPEHPVQLGQRRALVGHAAEHERDDGGVEGAVVRGDALGQPVDHGDRHRGPRGRSDRVLPQVRLRLDGQHLVDRRRVVREVRAGARTDLDDPPGEARQQPRAVLGGPVRLHGGGDPDPQAGEPGVLHRRPVDRASGHGSTMTSGRRPGNGPPTPPRDRRRSRDPRRARILSSRAPREPCPAPRCPDDAPMSVVEERPGADRTAREAVGQAARRRTFAVISHPDAGKSTLTEALALHARAIGQAGAMHGKAGRRGTVSDWMDMEQQRGISISSAALQFEYAASSSTCSTPPATPTSPRTPTGCWPPSTPRSCSSTRPRAWRPRR